MTELFVVVNICDEYPFDSIKIDVFKTRPEADRRIDEIKDSVGREFVGIKLYSVDLTSSDLSKNNIVSWCGNDRDVRDEKRFDRMMNEEDYHVAGYEDEDDWTEED